MKLARNVSMYGVEAVFGRAVLHEYEMDAMRIARRVAVAFEERKASGNYAEWEKANPSRASTLQWAQAEFERQR